MLPFQKDPKLAPSRSRSTRTGGGDPLVADMILARNFRSCYITDQPQHPARRNEDVARQVDHDENLDGRLAFQSVEYSDG
jgi:hypothetical protein